ncbi:MAG: hypothetical protein ACLQMH_12550 [Solirubrobacteraceae bacterium]
MLTPAILLARATELGAPIAARDDWIERQIAGRKLKIPNRAPIWLPKPATAWASDAIDQVEETYPGMAPTLITAALTRPLRAYELVHTTDERRVALLSAFDLPEAAPVLGSGVVLLRLHSRQLREAAPLEFELVPIGATDGLLDFLEELGLELSDDDRARPDPDLTQPARTLWVGGSAAETGREDWFRLVVAASQPLGLASEGPLQNPSGYLGQARSRIGGHGGGPVVMWKPRCGPQYAALAAVANAPLITLEERELADALYEFRLAVLEKFPGSSLPGTGRAADQEFSPKSWGEAHSNLHRLTSEAFVMTDRARAHCANGNGYADYRRMWRFLRILADLAGAWREADCSIGGRFDAWAVEQFGIEIALHDSTLGVDTTLFRHEETEYSREPHVKVDDYKQPNECGRIYFALDSDRQRLIVDHVGLHL